MQSSLLEILHDNYGSPDDYYEAIHRAAGDAHLFRDGVLDAWVVTGYRECADLLAGDDLDRSRLALRPSETMPDLVETVQGILNAQTMFGDGADFEARRKYWSRCLRPDIGEGYDAAAIAASCIDEQAGRAEIDAYSGLLQPFVSRAVCERLGIGEQRRRTLYPAIVQYARFLDGKVKSREEIDGALYAILSLYSRISSMPAGQEVACYHERHPYLADFALTIAAGHESTAYLLANVLLYLEGTGRRLNAASADHRMLGALVREATRHDGPVQMIGRRAKRSIVVNGRVVEEGDRVFIHIGAANRDPRAFDEPHIFDPERGGPPHLGFGVGGSRCPGIGLSVDESVAFLATLAARGTRVVIDRERIEWDHGLAGRGFRSLPARLLDA